MNSDIEKRTEALIRQAGELMLGFRQLQVTSKGRHGDYVTQADRAVQDMLLSGLSSLYPEAAFIAEEKDNGALPDQPAFIIDPIDGTTNFFRHRESSVISVGLTVNQRAAEGWIYNPYRGGNVPCGQRKRRLAQRRKDIRFPCPGKKRPRISGHLLLL